MPKLSPISWQLFIKRMRSFGFSGPYQSGKHPYMVKGILTITVPNPHDGDIGIDLLRRILNQAGISRDRWINKKR
jgi:predicted RNA binding protein YcfA (HicA-like mRNA interferase family)